MKDFFEIKIKPLSLNHAYRGRRFATPELKQYQHDLRLLLPKLTVPGGKLALAYEFGVSSKAADADNLSKAITDCLAEQYGFNDNRVYAFSIIKVDVPKGKEYIKFAIGVWRQNQ